MAKAKPNEPTEDRQSKNKRPRRVFQCMNENHPSMLVTFQRTAHTDDVGNSFGPVSKVLHVNQAGQFILPDGCEYYDEQLEGLRRAAERIEMVDMSDLKDPKKDGLEEGQPPAKWSRAPDPTQELIDAQRALDEQSEELTQQRALSAEQEAQIAQLQVDLAKAQGK